MLVKSKKAAWAVALALGLVGGSGHAEEPSTTAATPVAEQPSATPRGTTFLLPVGWAKRVQGNAVFVTPPEADGSRIVIVDAVSNSPDAAIAEAWALLEMTPKLMVATDAAPRDGWEHRRFYEYDVAANAKRLISAGAYRRGKAWTVVLADVDQAIAEKRSSQVGKLYQRLQPAGYTRETFAGRTAHKLDAARLRQVSDFVENMRKDYDVPGVAIGIVQDGKVVLSQGFGVRELGKPDAVGGDTRFMIASNTKALTTLMLAKLVDAGKLDWNARAEDIYPAFRLGDAATTDKVLVKHLICACTGVPRQDFEWLFEGEKQTPQTVMATLGTMQPTSGFGELFQYSNPMAAAAGYIGGQVAFPASELGAGYDQAMQVLVFDPLGMRNTTFDYAKAQTGDYASPHGYDIRHQVQVMGMGLNDTIRASRPAGAAWATVNDLLKYVQMEIDHGKLPDGSRYIGEAALMQRREPQISLGVGKDYAMALMVDNSDGVRVIDHGGDMGGFHSNMMWWPDQKVGAVILTNADEGVNLRGPLKRRLMELMFDGKPEAMATAAANAKANRAAFDAFVKLLQWPADPSALAGLAPRYRNAALGDLEVSRKDGKAWFNVGAFASEVATMPQPDGSLAFVTIDPEASGFLFTRADKDRVRKLVVRDGQHEYVFDEAPPSLATPAARQLAQDAVIVDTHIDAPTELLKEWKDLGELAAGREFDYPKAREGGLDVAFMSIYTSPEEDETGKARQVANMQIDAIEAMVARHPERFAILRSPADVERLRTGNRVLLSLGMENGAPIGDDLAQLAQFQARGVRYITLAHSRSNRISDSSYDRHHQWNGLSPFGEKVVAEMNRLGIMVDVSHLSDDAERDAIRLSRVPVIASHSAFRHFTPGFERNISDELAKAVADKGGVVQIPFGIAFVNAKAAADLQGFFDAASALDKRNAEAKAAGRPLEDASAFEKKWDADHPLPSTGIDAVLDEIDYGVKLIGIDHVGLGSDFDGVLGGLPDGLRSVADYPNLVAGLQGRGYRDADIRKILGGNLLRVWAAVDAGKVIE